MWQELYKTVFRYLLKLGLSRQDAEDMAQEALLSTYLHLDGIRPGKLHAYLLATARHKCIDFLRKNNREFAVPFVREVGVDDFSEISRMESEETIRGALDTLSRTEQKLFHLKYGMGLTNSEISSLLNTSPDSVKAMLWRVRKKVKDHLEKEAGI